MAKIVDFVENDYNQTLEINLLSVRSVLIMQKRVEAGNLSRSFRGK